MHGCSLLLAAALAPLVCSDSSGAAGAGSDAAAGRDASGAAGDAGSGAGTGRRSASAAAAAVTVGERVLEPQFLGIGYNLLPGLIKWGWGPMDSTFIDEVYGKRLREIGPTWARLALWDERGMGNLTAAQRAQASSAVLRTLGLLEQAGAAVYLTNWEPPYINFTAAPRQLEAYSAERAAAVRRLKAAAPTALRWYGIANEMDMKLPWFNSTRPGASYCALFGRTPQGWRPHPAVPGEQNGTAIYEAYLRSAHRAFAAAGVDVGMLATDQGLGCDRNASADPFESIGSVRTTFLFSSVRAGT